MRWWRRVATVLIISLAGEASPAMDGAGWQKVENADCKVWNGDPQVHESVTWTGPCVDGKAQGTGVLVWRYERFGRRLESRYEGAMRAGRLHGYGVRLSGRGTVLVGHFTDGNVEGHGAITWANGNRYEGEFVRGLRQGRGVFVWYDGDEYAGPWVHGWKHGKGICRASSEAEAVPCCYNFGRRVACPQ